MDFEILVDTLLQPLIYQKGFISVRAMYTVSNHRLKFLARLDKSFLVPAWPTFRSSSNFIHLLTFSRHFTTCFNSSVFWKLSSSPWPLLLHTLSTPACISFSLRRGVDSIHSNHILHYWLHNLYLYKLFFFLEIQIREVEVKWGQRIDSADAVR